MTSKAATKTKTTAAATAPVATPAAARKPRPSRSMHAKAARNNARIAAEQAIALGNRAAVVANEVEAAIKAMDSGLVYRTEVLATVADDVRVAFLQAETDMAIAALDDSNEPDTEAAAISKLGYVDFFLEPRLVISIDDGGLTLSPYDAASPGNAGLRGTTVAVEVLSGALPAYRIDHANTMDLRHLLAKHVEPTLDQDAERLAEITVADLERALKSSEGQGEALAESVSDLLDKLAEARTERDHADKAADAAAFEISGLQTAIADLRHSLSASRDQVSTLELGADTAAKRIADFQRALDRKTYRIVQMTTERDDLQRKAGSLEFDLSAEKTSNRIMNAKLLAVFNRGFFARLVNRAA